MEFEQGDVVLCTVDRIIGTTVFVKIDNPRKGTGEIIEGTIVMSEVAPGRIRNLRDYVVPKKKIVCKILRINSEENIQLSLRRVTQKEKKELLEKNKQEKSYEMVLKSIFWGDSKKIIEKILEKDSIYNFLEKSKESPQELEKIVGKENSKKIIEILKSQKKKTSTIKKEISLTTSEPEGLELIKNVLGKIKNAEVRYISAGRYSISSESEDLKKSDNIIREIISDLEKESKENKLNLSVKEK